MRKGIHGFTVRLFAMLTVLLAGLPTGLRCAAAEELQALPLSPVIGREELAEPVLTAPSSSDPMMILVVLVIVSGVALAGMTIASAISRRKKDK